MQELEFTFHLHGCEVWGFQVKPDTVKGVVVLVHGFGEHSGRYREAVIPMLLNSGIAVFTYDNVGHGKSSGKRGHCRNYSALLDILGEVIEKAESAYPNISLFLYGHSMGGNMVLNYALRRENTISGIIATSPYLRLAFEPPLWKEALGRYMMLIGIFPSITLPSGLDPNGISRIPKEVEIYNTDALIHDRVSPMYSFPVMDAGEWAITNADKLSCDTLLLHGTGDQIIDYKGTEEFHQNSEKTTLKLFEGGYHELHYDLCSKEMLTAVSTWLQQRI